MELIEIERMGMRFLSVDLVVHSVQAGRAVKQVTILAQTGSRVLAPSF